MSWGSSSTAVTIVWSRGIVGRSGIERLGVAVDVPASLVQSKLI